MGCFGLLPRIRRRLQRPKASNSKDLDNETSKGIEKSTHIVDIPIVAPLNSDTVATVNAVPQQITSSDQPINVDAGHATAAPLPSNDIPPTGHDDPVNIDSNPEISIPSSPISHTEESQRPISPSISPTQYHASGYCALCRTRLPHNPLPVLVKRTEPWEQWENECRAVLCLDVSDESDHLITHPFTLRDQDFESCISVPIRHSSFDMVNLHLEIPDLGKNIAYLFHSWCYDVYQWKTKSIIEDPVTVYGLAKALSHEASLWETIGTNGDGWLDAPSRVEKLIGDLNDEENHKWLPNFMSRLPTELRAPIWGYVGMRSAYSSFFLVAQETAALTSKLGTFRDSTVNIEKGSVVYWDTIKFFGSEYIRLLGNEPSTHSLEIKEDLKSIKIIAGLPGVCAIQFIGESWESEWIGKVPLGGQVWYGTLEGPGPTIEAKFTGLTCLDIVHKEPPQLMWDRPDFPPHITERVQLQEEATFLRWQSTTKSRFEFMRHLPLVRGKETARGLTFYCNEMGIIGIAAHFTGKTIVSGYRDGLPTYIPFQQGEGIRLLFYRLGLKTADCPGFVLETTKGRIHHIGPYMDHLNDAPICRWIPINVYTYTSITSITFQNPRREIFCAAVHGPVANRQVLYPKLAPAFPINPVPSMGFSIAEMEDMEELGRVGDVVKPVSGNGLFFSMAPLESVIKIRSCSVGQRIIGLLFDYEDRTQIALGQWYVEDTYSKARIATVYECSEPVKSVSFRLRGEQGRKEVIEVSTGLETTSVVGASESVSYFWSGNSIVWWYSKDYDHITLWEGQYYDIPADHNLWAH